VGIVGQMWALSRTNILSNLLTPKVKPSFRLNFVGDILSYWSHAQLVFCFYISIKFLIRGLFKGCKKATFGGLGEPPASSLTTENVRFRQQMADLNYKATAERVWTRKKKVRVFRTSHVSNTEMIEVSNRRLARHDDRSW